MLGEDNVICVFLRFKDLMSLASYQINKTTDTFDTSKNDSLPLRKVTAGGPNSNTAFGILSHRALQVSDRSLNMTPTQLPISLYNKYVTQTTKW